MKGQPFDFRGTEMTVRITTDEAGGAYSLIAMRHPPAVGPALHVHPRGAESFYVLEGTYTFFRGEEVVHAGPGDAVTIGAGVPHRYVAGSQGGHALVITPAHLEEYFIQVADKLRMGPVSIDEEFALAAEFGQEFLDRTGHWGAS